jgi:hypothetical protein
MLPNGSMFRETPSSRISVWRPVSNEHGQADGRSNSSLRKHGRLPCNSAIARLMTQNVYRVLEPMIDHDSSLCLLCTKRAGNDHHTVLDKAACIIVQNGRNQECRFLCKAHKYTGYLYVHRIVFKSFIEWIGCSMQVMQTSRTISDPNEIFDAAQCRRTVVCMSWQAIEAVENID